MISYPALEGTPAGWRERAFGGHGRRAIVDLDGASAVTRSRRSPSRRPSFRASNRERSRSRALGEATSCRRYGAAGRVLAEWDYLTGFGCGFLHQALNGSFRVCQHVDVSRGPELRFGLGWPASVRSALWRVKVGGDGSIYLFSEPTGFAFKASYHPPRAGREGGGASRLAFTSEYVERGALPDGQDRLIRQWDRSEGRLDGPYQQLGAVVLGRFSLGTYPADGEPDEEQGVEWIQTIPPHGEAWQCTLVLGDVGVRAAEPPGSRSMDALPVGMLSLRDGAELWVMRHRLPFTDAMTTMIRRAVHHALIRFPPTNEHRVIRSQVFLEDPGLQSFCDVAVSTGAALEAPVPPHVREALDFEHQGDQTHGLGPGTT